MKTYAVIILVLVLLFLSFFLSEYFGYRKHLKKVIEESGKAFGRLSSKRLSLDDLERAKSLFRRYENCDSIDDITASDLDIDEIFFNFDISLSMPGREYFYSLLRNPEYDKEKLSEFDKKVSLYVHDEEKRSKLRSFFLRVGFLNKANFFDSIDYFDLVPIRSILKEYLSVLFVFAGIAFLFVDTPIRVVVLIVSLVVNILTYYKARGEIENSVATLGYINRFINIADKMCKEKDTIPNEEYEELVALTQKLRKINRVSLFVTNSSRQTGAGNPLDIMADYLRMLFHIDIINFYKTLSFIKANKADIEALYVLLGRIETYATAASVRVAFPSHCKPDSGEGISFTNLYHPLVENPVKNSIDAKGGVLITGSNASGKSTFLKTVALNCLFAKTLGIALADSFSMDDYHLFSSMSLRDNLLEKDSYFMVEIKALKRIFDYSVNNPDKKIICFVDEVLRGTNTVERIAACTCILKNLKEHGVLCFAATHDIELTSLLEKDYSNYHFDEEIKDDDVLFNYKLKEGKATSKNAIKLLSIMGFSDDIVESAKKMADDFVVSGKWETL